MDQAQQRHLGGLARFGRDLDVLEPFEEHLPQAVDRPPAELMRHLFSALALLCRLQRVGGRAGLGASCRMQAFHQPAQQLGRVDAKFMRFVELDQGRGRVAGKDQPKQPADPSTVGKTEHVADLVGGNAPRAMGDRLVEDRQAVARRALGRPGDHAERFGLDLHPFRLRNRGEVRGQLLRRDSPQVEALGARQHRHRHLTHFGRREQELHMLRRFLKCLEQGVESRLGQHVDFVDDVDLVARR